MRREGEERFIVKEKSRDLQRVYLSLQLSNYLNVRKTTWGQRINHIKGTERMSLRAHIKPRIVCVPNSQRCVGEGRDAAGTETNKNPAIIPRASSRESRRVLP